MLCSNTRLDNDGFYYTRLNDGTGTMYYGKAKTDKESHAIAMRKYREAEKEKVHVDNDLKDAER